MSQPASPAENPAPLAHSARRASGSPSEPPIRRRPLLRAESPAAVLRVEAQAITLAPGAPVPRHTHPCAVVGVVLEGTIRYAREGAPEQLLRAGDAFHEPAHVLVHHFDNASADAPATFVAIYLVERDGPTIELVE